MIVKIADNILSPLGATTAENLAAVRDYRSALQLHTRWEIPEPFMASLFEPGQLPDCSYEGALCQSIAEALSQVPSLDVTTSKTILILSSTKGNTTGAERVCMGESARKIAEHFGISTLPITMSNACISGLSSQILAMRLLESGAYDTAIVAGCDIQSKFIVSGFQSFHAVSDEECRPFDEDRFGLNLGEAAATIVYVRRDEATVSDWVMTKGCVRNDAFHISSPSKTAEGSFRSLSQVMANESADSLACISAHGTATLYNDDMESKSIERAGLSDVLVNGLKGYYGHTMGAAGLLETIVMMHAVDEGWVPGTRGYEACGTSCDLHLTAEHQPTDKHQFVKMMSGFGGCNAAALYKKGGERRERNVMSSLRSLAEIRITPAEVMLNGRPVATTQTGKAMLTELYKQRVGDYPKFYKMDPLARLGFIAAELLLQSVDEEHFVERDDRAIVLVNRSASVAADRKYEESILPGENYFPSPADFVYTLPNIVTGEIAIRHHYHGETSFLVLDRCDGEVMKQLMQQAFADPGTHSVLGGWLECIDENHFEAHLALYIQY